MFGEILSCLLGLVIGNYNAPKNLDAGKLLDAVTIEQGILVERARDVYSFSHLTLVAGVMRGGADKLLLLMEKEAQKYINTLKLQALLNWAEQVKVGSEGNYKPVGKRAVAIANANAKSHRNLAKKLI